MAYDFLNSKKKKEIIKILEKQFGYDKSLDIHFIRDIDNIYALSSDSITVPLDKLRISQIGARIGIMKKENLILTIHGAQLIGQKCSKNIIELDDQKTRKFLKGEDIDLDHKIKDGLYLLKDTSRNDFFGCTKIKNNTIKNNTEKCRIINCQD